MAVRYAPKARAGQYTIERVLNTGNFAVSYAARAEGGRRVFLKQYKSPSPMVSWYAAYQAHQRELMRRIQGNGQLQERTCDFVEMFEHKRAFIQVYGFIEGGKDLKAYLAEGEMSPGQRYTFASLLFFTLRLFHAAGIVHTDLKPENVYLMPKPEARMGYNLKLIDFDFTVLDERQAPWDVKLAKDGQNYCGTPRYLSPEHLRAELPRAKSDVFTAAIICYELLTRGGHPFPEDEQAYKEAVLAGKVPEPDFIVSPDGAIEAFGRLLKQALSPDLAKRPTVEALHTALLKCRAGFTEGSPRSATPAPRPAPVPTLGSAAGAAHTQSRAGRLGLSMQGAEEIDWFAASSAFGSHSMVTAVKPFRLYCSGCQFVLRREGEAWFIDPAPQPPKNRVLYNGQELLESHRLAAGDIIALGSRKDPSKRNIAPMVVHLEEK